MTTHVLLIDDSESDGVLLRESLERRREHEFRVEQAFTLDAGLTILRDSAPDCVLLDLGLPDSAGLEGLNAVRACAPVTCSPGSAATSS